MPDKIDDNLDSGLARRHMPVVSFAAAADRDGIRGASAARLFQSFRGEKKLSTQTALSLWILWREIDSLCRSAEPFVLDLSDGDQVHTWLEAIRAGTLRLRVEHGETDLAAE
jgi:hypothetical protein